VNFFFDNNLAPKLAHSLHALVEPDHKIVHLKDLFAANEEDAEWMKKLSQQGDWTIITGDVRIRRNPHEVRAWKEAGHTLFFLKPGWTDLKFWEQAAKFTKYLPEIIETALRARRGSAFLVNVNGKIEELR
jgi:hypothetical protein